MNPADMTDEQREIARDIEATRERLGETVEELAHRLDVKAQVQGKVDETKQAVHAKVDHTKDAVQEKVAGARESVQEAIADPKTALSATAERFRGVAAEASGRRDIQIAAGVAAVSGLAGALLIRRAH